MVTLRARATVLKFVSQHARSRRHWGWNYSAGGVGLPFLTRQQELSLHTFASRSLFDDTDDQREGRNGQLRSQVSTRPLSAQLHSSSRDERAATLILGFGALAAFSYAGAQGVKAYQAFRSGASVDDAKQPSNKQEEEEQNQNKTFASYEPKDKQNDQEDENKSSSSSSSTSSSSSDRRENVFKEWFGVGIGSKYYEGGFEESMTRREAALILGVRESSSASRIKDAHRKLLILNHPDTGGSTYISGKINEAKELLMKGK